MFFNVLDAKELVKTGERKFEKTVLLQNNLSSFSIVGLQKDEIIDTHTAEENAAVYVLEGEIEIHFEAEKFTLKEGNLIMFKKDISHKVLALKNSKFLLIKI